MGGRVSPLPSQPLSTGCPRQSLLYAVTALAEMWSTFRRAVLIEFILETYVRLFNQLHTTEVSSIIFKNKNNRYISQKHSKRDGSELEGWEKMVKVTRNLCQFKEPWAEWFKENQRRKQLFSFYTQLYHLGGKTITEATHFITVLVFFCFVLFYLKRPRKGKKKKGKTILMF